MTEEQEQPVLVPVKIVGSKDKSTIVQTADFRRYYVPASKVKDNQVEQSVLDKGILYGIPWEQYIDGITADSLALMLRQAGIYTLADLNVRDRQLIRIGTNTIGRVVRTAAGRAEDGKPPRRSK